MSRVENLLPHINITMFNEEVFAQSGLEMQSWYWWNWLSHKPNCMKGPLGSSRSSRGTVQFMYRTRWKLKSSGLITYFDSVLTALLGPQRSKV